MIKVRQHCFETNSSSTHSVTIRNRSKQPENVKPVCEDGILYPKRLSQFSHEIGCDGSSLVCNTRDMKAALFLSWILNLCKEQLPDEHDVDGEECLARYSDYVLEHLGYKGVDFEGEKWGDYPNGEYDENLTLCGDWEEDKEQLDNIIRYVNDDNVEFADEDIPY